MPKQNTDLPTRNKEYWRGGPSYLQAALRCFIFAALINVCFHAWSSVQTQGLVLFIYIASVSLPESRNF